jgi:hypothetical protein
MILGKSPAVCGFWPLFLLPCTGPEKGLAAGAFIHSGGLALWIKLVDNPVETWGKQQINSEKPGLPGNQIPARRLYCGRSFL